MKVVDDIYAFIWGSMTTNNCNTYLIDGPTRLLIDPGHKDLFDHVRRGLDKFGFSVEDIGLVIITHAHPDHIEGAQLFKKTPALVTIHETEWRLLKTMKKQITTAYGFDLDSVTPDFLLKEGELSVNGRDFIILHTPGHSPGSISLFWPEKGALFTGDVIFKEGIGRTDLPGGDGNQLKKSIQRLSELEAAYVLPGHGGIISGATEVRANFDALERVWFPYL